MFAQGTVSLGVAAIDRATNYLEVGVGSNFGAKWWTIRAHSGSGKPRVVGSYSASNLRVSALADVPLSMPMVLDAAVFAKGASWDHVVSSMQQKRLKILCRCCFQFF